MQLHTSYLCPVIAKLQTDADNKSKDLHEKTASSPGQRRAGGDDKSGLVVNTESGVSGVAWTKRMGLKHVCKRILTNSGDIGGSVDPVDSTCHLLFRNSTLDRSPVVVTSFIQPA